MNEDTTSSKLDRANTLLEELEKSQVVGFCFINEEGKLDQIFPRDEVIRDMLLAYQTRCVSQLMPQKKSLMSRQKLNHA